MNISSSNERPSSAPRRGIFNFFRSEEYNVSASDAANLLLVVATLIATVTFQIGVNPPGGVWQDTKDGHEAGTAIYAPLPREVIPNVTTNVTNSTVTLQSFERRRVTYFMFLYGNTITLSISVVVMLFLTSKFPLRNLIRLALLGMLVTYGSSICIITPAGYTRDTLFVLIGFSPVGLWIPFYLCDKFLAFISQRK